MKLYEESHWSRGRLKNSDTHLLFLAPLLPPIPSDQIKIPLEERGERGKRPSRKKWVEKGINIQPEQGGPVSMAGQLPEAIQSVGQWGGFTAVLCYCGNYPCLVTLLSLSDTPSSQHTTHCLSVRNDKLHSQQALPPLNCPPSPPPSMCSAGLSMAW